MQHLKHLKQLYSITSNHDLSFADKVDALLNLGAEVFDLDLGIVSEIIGDDYIVRYAISPDNTLSPDLMFPLGNTYCVHTLKVNDSVSFHHAGKSYIKKHPCYIGFGLESYIGAPLLVEGQRYGTLNFSAEKPKLQPFTKQDHEFIELLAHWIGNEIAIHNKICLLETQQIELERQQTVLEDIGQLAGVGAWEVDLRTETVYWSSMTKQIHEVDQNYEPDLASGINFYKEGDSRDRIKACIDKAVVEGGRYGGEFEIVTYTGKTKWVAVEGRAELEKGECVRLIGAFQDITHQVFYREQLERRHKELSTAMDARNVFLANMSHEVRTPINGVLGVLQVLRSDNLDDEQQRFISMARESASSLLDLVNDLLDFSKIESGQIEFEVIPFNLNDFFTNCVAVFNLATNEKSLQLDLDFSASKDISVKGDPTRIRQILANLISNAIKFTPSGTIKISSAVQKINQQKVNVTVTVQDTGIGMSTEQLQQLFLPFRQADVSTTRQYGGTGLGLSISHQLAKLMNGEILVESRFGEGSSFTLSIDLTLDSSMEIELNEIETTTEKDLSKLNVLVVEDNEINQVILCEMLRQRNMSFELANDGLEALLKLQDTTLPSFSLVLMDCQMPNMDGYEATKEIRALNTENKDIPIIALTANAMPDDRAKCIALGMNDYISKPLDKNILYKVLEKYFA